MADEARDAFVEKREHRLTEQLMADKRMTDDEVVAELRDGMTIGIGGWGSRRKPMSLVRAILRSDLTDLTVVPTAVPTSACCAPPARCARSSSASSRSTRSRSSRTSAPPARTGTIEAEEYDEGMFQWGSTRPRLRLPFLPTRAGLGSDVMRSTRELRTVRSPYDDGEELVAMPALRLDAALVHLNRADAARQRPVPRARPRTSTTCSAWRPTARSCRASRSSPTEDFWTEGAGAHAAINRLHDRRRGRGAGRRPLHLVRARLRAGRGVPDGVRDGGRDPRRGTAFEAEYLDVDEDDYQAEVRPR